MKNIILTLGIFMATTGAVFAQNNPVAKSTFNASVTKLSTAIDQKSLSIQNGAIHDLLGLMANQLTYLKATCGKPGTPQGTQDHQTITSDTDVETYVKGLPTNAIVADKATLISKLNQFAATCK